jgi:hypothetical protein
MVCGRSAMVERARCEIVMPSYALAYVRNLILLTYY